MQKTGGVRCYSGNGEPVNSNLNNTHVSGRTPCQAKIFQGQENSVIAETMVRKVMYSFRLPPFIREGSFLKSACRRGGSLPACGRLVYSVRNRLPGVPKMLYWCGNSPELPKLRCRSQKTRRKPERVRGIMDKVSKERRAKTAAQRPAKHPQPVLGRKPIILGSIHLSYQSEKATSTVLKLTGHRIVSPVTPVQNRKVKALSVENLQKWRPQELARCDVRPSKVQCCCHHPPRQ